MSEERDEGDEEEKIRGQDERSLWEEEEEKDKGER